MSDSGKDGKRPRRKKKEKKVAINISLWINGVTYKFGLNCTFCEKSRAIVHCPECKDFYCTPCDTTAHSHNKRKHHVRAALSLFDIPTAAHICTRAMRFLSHLKKLQRRCREKFRRQFDVHTLCHYYVNTVYNIVSWRKPYCLRHEELFPFLTPVEAATRMQGLYRMRKARHKTLELLFQQFEKIFDRTEQKFYYAYVGQSTIIPNASWFPPLLLSRRGYYGSLRIVFTEDVAAMIIQRKWRVYLMYCFLKALVRVVFKREWDPIAGCWAYINQNNFERMHTKPLLLHGDHWDPNEVPDWSVHEMTVFIRRLGLKQYVPGFKRFGIDGKSILLLDTIDYPTVGITDIIHIRKIEVEIAKLYPLWLRKDITQLHLIRRDKLKRQKQLDEASITVQRVFRGYLGRIDARNLREVNRVLEIEKTRDHMVKTNAAWWLERVQHNRAGTNYVLPPLKEYGRKRSHYTAKGWGTISDTKWVPLPNKEFIDCHVTTQYTEKLRRSGYDRRRLELRKMLNELGPPPKIAFKARRKEDMFL